MANEHAIQATGTFVVSKGFRLLTKLAASQGSLQFTRAAVGTGKPPEGYSPESMIGLNAYKIDAEIADYGVQDDMAYITVQVSSDNVTEGFLVTEVGVFAEDPDEGEILYGYMDISTDPTYIYANGSTNRSKFAEFTLYVLVGSVSNVIAAVTPGSIITRDTFTAANLKAIDTHGILGGEAGAETTGQGLIDAIANKLLTEFVTNTVLMERLGTYVLKSKIVNDFLSTDEETVLSGPMGKLLKEQLNVLNTNFADAIIKSTYKTALRSPDKTHTLGIHDNGTAYMDDTKVITNADLIHGNTDAFSIPANSERRITVDLSRYNVGTNYRLYAVVRGSTWANVGAIYCNNNQTIIDTRNLNSTAVNISLWYTVIRK